MKNFTNNFKQFTSRLSARWLIMALMLLVGTSSAWGRNYDGTEKLYFKMDAVSWWNCGTDGNQNFAYFFNNSTSKNAWSEHAVKVENNIYYVLVPKGDWQYVILTRNSVTSSPSFDNKYNQTGDIAIDASKNYIKGFSENSNTATWGTYTPVTVTGYQLAGFNDWSNPITMTKNGNIYTCTKTLTAKTYTGGSNEAGFKIIENYSNSTQKWYGNTGTMTRASCSNWTFSEGSNNNCGITADVAGTYTFTFDASTKKLSVTYPAQLYTITYNANGGSGAPDNQTKTHGTALTLSSTKPTRTGYTFQDWNTKADGTGTTYLSGAQYTANAAATLYAQWTANQYDITYKDQGDAAFSGTHASDYPTKHTYGTATTLKTATKAGYTFGGWFTTSACTGNAVTSLGATDYTSAITLYAKWTEVCNPISDLTWTITSGAKTTYCPGDEVTVTMTYNGTTAKSYSWGGNWNGNIGLSEGSLASGAVYTMTINKSGSVNLTLTGCDEKIATTETLTFNVVQAPETPTVSVIQNIIKCGNEITQSGKIRITNYNSNYSYKIGANNDPLPASSIDAQGNISGLTIADKFTLYAINSCGTETPSAQFTITETNNTPTISGKTSTQPGKSNAIELTVPSGITASWSVSPNADLSVSSGNSTMFSSENEGTYTITAIYNGCSDTHVVTVSRGYTVYLRRPHAKNETQQYNYWYEMSSKPGPGYVKFGTVKKDIDTSSTTDYKNIYNYNGGTDKEVKDPNEVATLGVEAFTDCEDYVWDAYNIGLDVTALYFRAPNDKNLFGGWATYTWSYTQNTPIAENMYFTMGDWPGKSQEGRALNKVNKPFDGVTIDALGSTEICSNNMASFAALYLESNCTGQEITAYAWKFSTDNSRWNDYNTGKGAKTNNIRPNKAGYYHLECTLKDGTVVTSNSIQITTKTCTISNSSLNNITSNLPIIMVNTGEKSFPECENTTDFPTKHADKLKKKRSVDVKILWNPNGTVSSSDAYSNGETLYYDRKARMNYRGSSSLNFEKKSYAFCPGDENCGQDEDESPDYVKTKKMNMFGIGSAEDKDWVLYAAYVDPTMMRNMLAMETYSAMTGKWGVKGKYVELYVDGEYQGVYIFMDKITQNDNRVNIKWKIDKTDDSKSKRQFILKFDKTDPADRIGGYNGKVGDEKTFKTDRTGKKDIETYGTKIDQMFEIEYPEKEDIEEDYGVGAWAEVNSFIQRKVDELEDAIYSQNYTKVRELLDYTSWADFFILNEYTKNEDAYRASCVFVFNGEKFEVWPLWDYELSFNNRVTKQGKNNGIATGLLIKTQAVYNDAFPAPFWWTGKDDKGTAGLLADDCFLQMIASRWATHTSASGALNPTNIQDLVDSYKEILTKNNAHTRDAAKWPYSSRGISACNRDKTGYYSSGDGGSIDSFNASLTDLENWIGTSGRIGSSSYGLTKAIDDLTGELEFTITATADKDVTTPWRPVNITVNAVGAGYTYSISPATIGGQVVVGNDNFLIYPEATGEYTVTTTLDAASQCGNSGENPTHTLKFKVEKLDDICPAPGN